MAELSEDQRALAHAHGVATEYDDWQGKHVVVATDTVVAVLAALGVDAEQKRSLLPPCAVLVAGEAARIELSLPTGATASATAQLTLEDGSIPDIAVTGDAIALPDDLPLGYHELRARSDSGEDAVCTVIVTPAFLGFPASLGNDRTWGLATQLYSVRSRGSWGVGDLEDLRQLATWSARELGAGYVLVNPLSAAEPVAPMEPSPYLPSSRRFVNPLYLRVESLPEYADLEHDVRATIERLRDEVQQELRDVDRIDRDVAWTAKNTALRLLHTRPRTPDRDDGYRAFREQQGDALRDFATWCAIVENHGTDATEWPDGLDHPANPEVAGFREAHATLVDYYSWLQWTLDEQLAGVQAAARAAGMPLGVMHDLAVGVHPEGADAWAMQDVLAQGINVGAPPDAFNQVGQDWSQPPWRPDTLIAAAYGPFRALVAQLLRHAGALRIDHILGLFRLWWIPKGVGADQGTYVRYDHKALIGILALEAARAGAVVVGEDLGTVEPFVREYLKERGIIGTSILWFERDGDGHPLPAEQWREYCLASVNTHDLPPTAGYLAGEHVVLRDRLGLLTRPLADERAADEADRAAWLDVLIQEGLLSKGATEEETITALHVYLTRTPSRLVGVALADAVGDRRTQNQPGTSDEYPNWRVPLTGPRGEQLLLEDIAASARAKALAAAVRAGLTRR